ncbi:centrosomal protein of 295 kDa [Silurus asotus]|uniref:Centrosomal protein of 295 kDa n=1 Tax=Silurus asotus TaxID=30991 RepID=A0AAD5FBN3_SILAS|nr:centrosomal protein of 295 kDa [Silurus asotus]
MKQKSRNVNRLSPNEEEQLIREELQRRRKLRLQQVREQERHIALQVRREVQERRERELQSLATALRDEWQKQRGERIQSLEKLYKENLRDVGQGHRDGRKNEPNLEALAVKKEENNTRATERHQKALRNLITQRQAEAEQRNLHVEARKKALMVEKERAAKIASLPHPGPDPIQNVAIRAPLQPKMFNVEHYSVTHYHIPETAVDRETETVQPGAQEAAALEARRLEDQEKEETRDRQEQLERARLRGHHALRKEKDIQNNARMLHELKRLHQAELQRRRHVVNSMPAQIFQPLYRHEHLRAEQQRELEIAFQDLCIEDKEIRDDLVLQLGSEPLPPPVPSTNTDNRPDSDFDLDVTLEPKETACEEEDHDSGEEPVTSQTQFMRSTAPAEGMGRTALKRLLNRIRTQRDQWSRGESSDGQGEVRVESVSDENGSARNLEWQQASSLEEGTVETSLAENHSKVSEDSIVAGPKLQLDEQISAVDIRVTDEELRRQHQEQLSLLQELEEKRRTLELQLEEAQLCRQRLQDALQVPSGNCSLQETPPTPSQETIPEPSPEVNVSAPLSDSMHIRRLQQYQQRLLNQNRRHKKTIDGAYRNLEEYKRTLKMRYTPVTTAVAPTLPPSVHEETLPHRTLSSAFTHFPNHDPASTCPISTLPNIVHTDPVLLVQSSLPSSSPALTTLPDTHVTAPPATISVPNTMSHLVRKDGLASIPSSAASSLSDTKPLDGPSQDLQDVPLLPPAVFLEYLRSRRSHPLNTPLTPISQQVPQDPAVVLHKEVKDTNLHRNTETDRVRDRIRKQRDALQALIRTQHAEEQSTSIGTHGDIDAPVKEKSNEPLPSSTLSQSHVHTLQNPVFESNENSLCEPASGVRVNPPISCPPRTLQILLHDFEQHKLSTIEEVDTPSLLESAHYGLREQSGSERWLRNPKVRGEHKQTQQTVMEGDAMAGFNSFACRYRLYRAAAGRGDSSLFTTELPMKTGASLTHSSSFCGLTLSETTDSSRCSSSLQYIIDKYTKELDKSLRSVHTGGMPTALNVCAEEDTNAGSLAAPQPPTLPLQCNLEDCHSLNTTQQETFQSLSPEITNNTMTECSTTLQLPFNPPGEDSNTDASDWPDCSLPEHVSGKEGSAGVPQWEWTLGNKSEFRSLEASVSHEVQDVSNLQDSGEESIRTLQLKSFSEAETSPSSDRRGNVGLCSELVPGSVIRFRAKQEHTGGKLDVNCVCHINGKRVIVTDRNLLRCASPPSSYMPEGERERKKERENHF